MASDNYDYLNEERKKLWSEVNKIKDQQESTIEILKSISEKIDVLSTSTPEEIKTIKTNSKLSTEYRNKISASKEDALEKQDKITAIHEKIEEILESAIESLNQLTEIKDKSSILGFDIQEHASRAEEVSNLFDDLETIKSRIAILSTLSVETQQTQAKISQFLSNADFQSYEINSLHQKVFGFKDEEGNEVLGKIQEIEKSLEKAKSEIEDCSQKVNKTIESSSEQLQKYINSQNNSNNTTLKEWKNSVSAIIEKINSLMPQALTAGLSQAYNKKRETEEINSQKLTKYFNLSIIALSAVTIIPVGFGIYFSISTDVIYGINTLPKLTSSIIPLYIPLLWLAYSINKRLNLSKRLVEEYTHKEVISNTFEGLSNQIESIKDQTIANELRVRLLYNLLSVSAENPGKLISDYNKSDHPIMDVLDKSSNLTDAVEKLGRLPGISWLTQILEKRAEILIEEGSKKVEAGFKLSNNIDNEKKEDPA